MKKLVIDKGSLPKCSAKQGILKTFANFTLEDTRVGVSKACKFIEMRLKDRCFL